MRSLRRLNAWVLRPGSPPDPLGDSLFVLNKMILVYVLPLVTLVIAVALAR